MPAFTTAALAIGGVGMGAFGLSQQMKGAKATRQAAEQMRAEQTAAAAEINKFQVDEINAQLQVEAQRKKQMDLEYKRGQIQTVRDWQKASAMSLVTATSQGVGTGSNSSALAGSLAGEVAAGRFTQLGNNQNYQIGNDIFALNNQISQDRIGMANAQTRYGIAGVEGQTRMAEAQSRASTGAAMMSLGGSMISAAGTFGNVAKTASSGFGNMFSFGTGPGAWMSRA